MFVKLQRPPPEIRIFSPAAVAWSTTSTRRPRLPASMAHIMPAAPAPITTTSNWSKPPLKQSETRALFRVGHRPFAGLVARRELQIALVRVAVDERPRIERMGHAADLVLYREELGAAVRIDDIDEAILPL